METSYILDSNLNQCGFVYSGAKNLSSCVRIKKHMYTDFVEMKVPMFEKFGTNSVYVKGQLISNYLFGVIVSIKIATRIL